MATSPVAKARAASAATPAATAPATAEVQTKGVSRREFLFYIWGASFALLTAETTGAILWFSLPRFRAGEAGGVFTIDPASLPQKNAAPILNAAGRFWLSNSNDGFYALSAICTHLGCLFKWVDTNHRFECPCHGSHFNLNGTKRVGEGPAPINLNRFVVTVHTTGGGTVVTDDAGGPVKIDGATLIDINTGKKIPGKPAGQDQYGNPIDSLNQ